MSLDFDSIDRKPRDTPDGGASTEDLAAQFRAGLQSARATAGQRYAFNDTARQPHQTATDAAPRSDGRQAGPQPGRAPVPADDAGRPTLKPGAGWLGTEVGLAAAAFKELAHMQDMIEHAPVLTLDGKRFDRDAVKNEINDQLSRSGHRGGTFANGTPARDHSHQAAGAAAQMQTRASGDTATQPGGVHNRAPGHSHKAGGTPHNGAPAQRAKSPYASPHARPPHTKSPHGTAHTSGVRARVPDQKAAPPAAAPKPADQAARPPTPDTSETQAKAAIAALQAHRQSDPAKALAALNAAYAKASPEVAQKILADPYAQQIVHNAAHWADAALDQPEMFPQAQSALALERLDGLTAGVAPELAAQTVDAALPGFTAYAHASQYAGQLLGPEGATSLLNVLNRVGTSAAGTAAVEGFAGLGLYSSDAMRNAVAAGDSPAYLVALASQPGVDRSLVMQDAVNGVLQYAQNIHGDVETYAGKMQELSWLVKNEGGALTEQQLSAAVANYGKTKDGGDWQKQTGAALHQVAADGATLIKQLVALQNLPPSLSGQQDAVDAAIKTVVNDPQSAAAMQLALNQQPSLVAERGGANNNFQFFAGLVKVGDSGRKLAQESLTAFVKANWLPKIANADPNNLPAVKQQFEALKTNSNIYKVLGVSHRDFDRAIDAVEAALPAPGESPAQAAAKLGKLNQQLDTLEGPQGLKAFDKSTFAGQFLRTLGVAAAGVSTINAAQKAWTDPGVKNELSALVSAAGLGQKGLELGVGLNAIDAKSLPGKIGGGWKLADRFGAGEFLLTASAALDVYSAVDSFTKGDPTSGGLYLASAGGTALAVFGADWWAGPVGVAIALSAGVGLLLHGSAPTKYDSRAMAGFLEAGGVTDQAANALVGQSGKGYSPVALLQRYAALKGLDLGRAADQHKLVQWLNKLSPAQLSTLHDALDRAQDALGGDTARFNATGGNDWEVGYYADSGYRNDDAKADSVYLLDNLLWYSHAPQLVPSGNVP